MIRLKIDNKQIEVSKGTTVLEAAQELGIHIPTMCYKPGYNNHPSCMLCLVKDKSSGSLFPSCALQAVDGMEIISEDEEVRQARKESLELLLSDHVGDCEAPCRIACPAYMNIPLMNRLIASGKVEEALAVVKQEIALPLVLGFICPAPCEKVCRRGVIDEPVSICLLKRFAAGNFANSYRSYMPQKLSSNGKRVAIIGSGPAGLAAAYHLTQRGYFCTVLEKEEKAGGALRKYIPADTLPADILDKEIEYLGNYGVSFQLQTFVTRDSFEQEIQKEFDAVIVATGSSADSGLQQLGLKADDKGCFAYLENLTTQTPGVFACGSVIKDQRMAVRSLAQGKTAAWSVHVFLTGKLPKKIHRMFNSKIGMLDEAENQEYMKESVEGKRIEPAAGYLMGYADQEAIAEAQRCLHCDCRKSHNCLLRVYADEYEVDRRKFAPMERKRLVKFFQHQQVVYEPEKCIKCGLCIEITEKQEKLYGFTHIGRGFNIRIDTPFNLPLQEALSNAASACVEACPTGALAFKNQNKSEKS